MELDWTCSNCGDDASLFCRLCNLHYCFDHLCTHLQAAHEDNSYTNRLDRDIDEGAEENEDIQTEHDISERENSKDLRSGVLGSNSWIREFQSNGKVVLPLDAKPPSTYTESELKAQLDFHRNQARRIRNELERRALFATGTVPRDYAWEECSGNDFSKLHNSVRRHSTKPRVPKSVSRSVQILLNQLRHGTLSLEQIKAQISASQAAKKE